MTAIAAPAAAAPIRRAHTGPVTLVVLHPKGGVGRSTTVWHVGAELALRGYSVRIEDLDQGAHLTRVFGAYPLALDNLRLGDNAPADIVILDTAPEAQERRASSRYWLGQLERLAAEHGTRVLPPIDDMASIADKSIAGHPYAGVAEEVRARCLEPARRSRT